MVRLYEAGAQGLYNGENPRGKNTAQGHPCVHKVADMGAKTDKKGDLCKMRKVGVVYTLLVVPLGSGKLFCC
jgi:hypothetical protein